MPVAVVGVAAAAAGYGTSIAVGGGLLGAIVGGVVSSGINYLGSQIFSPSQPEAPAFVRANAILTSQANTNAPIPVVYGRRVIAGTRVFQHVSGSDNANLNVAIVLCEGEIDSFEVDYLDDISIDPHPARFASYVVRKTKRGTDDQTRFTHFVGASSKWTTAHKLSGLAAVGLVLKNPVGDKKVPWTRFPEYKARLLGKKVYDPRAAGHDPDDSSTWEWSDNPALCVLDYLLNTRFGKGLPIAEIDMDSFSDAADYCDEAIAFESGGTPKARYTCNAVVDTSRPILQNLDELLSTCRGMLVWSGGFYRLIIDAPVGAPVMTVTKDHIVGAWNIQTGGRAQRANSVKAHWTDPKHDYQTIMAGVESATYLAADNGEVLEHELDLAHVTDEQRARYLAQQHMNQSRQALVVSFRATPAIADVRVGDVIAITHDTPGWTAKEFRVMQMALTGSQELTVTCREYDAGVYTVGDLPEDEQATDTELPDPLSVATVTGLQVTSDESLVRLLPDGTLQPRARLTWTAAADGFAVRYEIRWKLAGDTVYSFAVVPSDTLEYIVELVQQGGSYDFGIRAVTAYGRTGEWAELTDYEIIGASSAPPAPDTFIVSRQGDGTREFRWTHADPPADLVGYKIRYYIGSTSDWSAMAPLHTGLLRASPWETNQLSAGSYTVAIKAIDALGIESDSALFISSTLGDPRFGDTFYQEDFGFAGWPGTLGSCYIDRYGELVAASSSTWADLTTWTAYVAWNNETPVASWTYEHTEIDLGVDLYTLPEISSIPVACSVTAEYQWRTAAGSYQGSWQAAPTEQVQARYFKARLTMTTTPSDATDVRLKGAAILFVGQAIEQEIQDLDTSTLTGANRIAVGHVKLPLDTTFSTITSVSLALQNVGAGWSWEVISKADTTNGPEVKIYNSSATLADATIDAIIRGL